MRTCPACGRQYPDDVTVCPEDREPLGAVTVVSATRTGDVDDEGTLVRPKQARPLERPRFTEVRIAPPEPVGSPSGPVARTDVPDRVYRERPVWPIWAAVAVLAVVGVALGIYYVTAGQSDLAKEVSTQITDARVAVADARARLESLPQDNPLRNKLLTLQQWDRELQNLELGHDRSREVAARARDIASQARSVGEEARVAGATIPATPPPVQPAAPAPATTTNANENAPDPMATKPEATNEATKPVEPPTVTPSTGAPPVDNKAPAEAPTQNKTPGPEPESKTPPVKVAPPPPPPSPDEKKP